VDRTRLLVGTRRPVLAGAIVGFFTGVFAFVALALLRTHRMGDEPGNVMPAFALIYGGPWGAIVGTVVALVVRRIVEREARERVESSPLR